ncbi:MAG: TonB-dependent receptor [Pseudomonadota bacterium]
MFRFLFLSIAIASYSLLHSAGAAEDSDRLEQVEVTGTKIDKDLQRSLISTTVLSGDLLQSTGVDDLKDAFRFIPNINASPSNNGNNGISIRGINSEGVGPPGGNQQSLSTFILDGAAQSLEGVRKGARGIWDLDSIEVLRGPQLALGRNALAGALVVKTNDPTQEFEASARYVVDALGHERAAMVSGPLTSELSYRFTAEEVRKEKDIDYLDPNVSFLADEDYYAFRAKILYEPDWLPGLTSKVTWSRAHDDPAITAVSGPDFFARRLEVPFTGIEQRINDVDNLIVDTRYDINNNWEFTSVSTLTRTETSFNTPSPSFNRDETRLDLDISQDTRLNYQSTDGKLSAVIGVFYGQYNNQRDSIVQALLPRTVQTTVTRDVSANACIDLNFTANGNGRWYDLFSNGYAQIDPPLPLHGQGFYLIFDDPIAGNANDPVGTGVDAFPFGATWNDAGELYLDLSSLTGVGEEVIPIVDSSFSFNDFIADDDNILNTKFDLATTAAGGGTVTFTDGEPTSVNANIPILFSLDATAFGFGVLNTAGEVSLNGDNFDLAAGEVLEANVGSATFAWDFDGSFAINNAGNCSPTGQSETVTFSSPTQELALATIQDLASTREIRNYGLYAQLDWQVYGPWRVVAGLRYDYEDFVYREVTRSDSLSLNADANFEALLPKFGLTYDLTANHSVGYVISRGYRSGFIDRGPSRTPTPTVVDPEFLWSHEIIFRTEWLDKRLRANANMFYYDWRDQQITIDDPSDPTRVVTQNAGRSEAYGLELSIFALVSDNIDVTMGVGLLQTRFLDFETDTGDLRGNEFPEAPQISASIAVNYATDSGWFLGGDVAYQSSNFATADLLNLKSRVVKGRPLMFLRAGYEAPNGSFRITAELNNVLNRQYLTGRDILNGAYVGDERTFGVNGQVWF